MNQISMITCQYRRILNIDYNQSTWCWREKPLKSWPPVRIADATQEDEEHEAENSDPSANPRILRARATAARFIPFFGPELL